MDPRERLEIRTTEDELEAWISVAQGPEGDESMVALALEDAGICDGIDDAILRRVEGAIERPTSGGTEWCIALGTPPKPPRPPHVVLEDPEAPIAGALREDGSMDFSERSWLVPVEPGQVIARLTPGTPGRPGTTVRGEEIDPPEPPEFELTLGDGVEWGENGEILATAAGARSWDPAGSIAVVDLHVHKGSVDAECGNLHTGADLQIERDVLASMKVRAGGKIRVGGAVDGGCVEAARSVEIVGGAFGRERGMIRAGGDLRVRHTLGIEIFARGRIEVARSLSTTKLHGREVEVNGRALSDRIDAEKRIRVNEAGSASGGPCVLRVGIPLEPENFDPTLRPAKVGAPRAQKRGRAKGRPDAGRAKGRRDRGARGKKTAAGGAGDHELTNVDIRIRWRQRQRELLTSARIEIGKLAHAGCRLHFGEVPLVLEQDVGPGTYRLDDDLRTIIVDDPNGKEQTHAAR